MPSFGRSLPRTRTLCLATGTESVPVRSECKQYIPTALASTVDRSALSRGSERKSARFRKERWTPLPMSCSNEVRWTKMEESSFPLFDRLGAPGGRLERGFLTRFAAFGCVTSVIVLREARHAALGT